MLLFQIDEAKMMERSAKKQIEQMETDNYLINIDIIRMKSQIDAYKSKNKKYKKNNIIKEEKSENEEKNEKFEKNDDLNKSRDSINSIDSKKDNNNKDEKSEDSNNENDIDDEIQPRKPSKSVARRGIMRVGNYDPSIKAMENAKNFSSKSVTNLDNLQIVKMKERLDDE